MSNICWVSHFLVQSQQLVATFQGEKNEGDVDIFLKHLSLKSDTNLTDKYSFSLKDYVMKFSTKNVAISPSL